MSAYITTMTVNLHADPAAKIAETRYSVNLPLSPEDLKNDPEYAASLKEAFAELSQDFFQCSRATCAFSYEMEQEDE